MRPDRHDIDFRVGPAQSMRTRTWAPGHGAQFAQHIAFGRVPAPVISPTAGQEWRFFLRT
jgi:hypothetical protein